MIVGHVVNHFDPSCDVLRCVRELNFYSQHEHLLYVRERHPDQDVYQFDEPEQPGWLMSDAEVSEYLAPADVLIYHFAGAERGWGWNLHENRARPSAFRNIHVTWNRQTDQFWTNEEYNAKSYALYKLLSASHAGAAEFLPADRFRWLPDLLPLDGAYSFDPAPRQLRTVSYIKHADELAQADFDGAFHLNCFRLPHSRVLELRRTSACVVIDNVCDGHYGLAGQEAAILGLPVVGFNHPRTLAAMEGWRIRDVAFPFVQARSLDQAVLLATSIAAHAADNPDQYLYYRQAIRNWAEKFLDPARLVREYWDPFILELAS